MTKREIRKICLQAHNEIVQMAQYITRLELALSCALPILEADEPGSEATMVAGMIRTAVGNENLPLPPLRRPQLIIDNGVRG